MADIYQVRSSIGDSGNGSKNEVKREDIEDAIAKSVELRALHASLMQGNSPVKLRFDLASPVSCSASQFSAQDYPVFTPSYERESLPGYQHHVLENRNYAEIWGEYFSDRENADETVSTEYRLQNPFSRKGLPSRLVSFHSLISPPEDQNAAACSCANNITVLGASPGPDSCKFRRNRLGDLTLIPASSCNKCKPAIISSEADGVTKNSKKSNVIVPYTDSNQSLNSQPSNKGMNFSCLFPRIKKSKDECSPKLPSTEEASQTRKDSEIVSIETLKMELIKANESRDAALVEVAEMKSVLGELGHKLEYLETYCEELKKALQVKNPQIHPTKDGKSVCGNGENLMPVSEEELIEEFLQLVSESRRTVKQFCKILVGQIQETDHTLVNNLNSVLQPYKLSLKYSKYSKPVLYHLEAIINQSLFQDFENIMFQRNGSPKILYPKQDRHKKLNSFVALRNLSWNDVLHKGINYYSDEFSKFCDNKMGGILATLRWTKPWSEQLLQAFFAAAKSIWLLHLLAFSSDPPFCIMRVDENRPFEARYMEDFFDSQQRLQNTDQRVKIMVLPGFYVQGRVVRCKVLCKYKHVT